MTEQRIVQTFTYEGEPDGVALETLTFEDLGDGRTRLHAQSLVDRSRVGTPGCAPAWRYGVNDGYANLDGLLVRLSGGHDVTIRPRHPQVAVHRHMARNSPARRVPSHGTDLFATTYAIDFIAVQGRRTAPTWDWRTLVYQGKLPRE